MLARFYCDRQSFGSGRQTVWLFCLAVPPKFDVDLTNTSTVSRAKVTEWLRATRFHLETSSKTICKIATRYECQQRISPHALFFAVVSDCRETFTRASRYVNITDQKEKW